MKWALISACFCLIVLLSGCSSGKTPIDTTPGFGYNESFRPNYHFSPAKGWINDPNGMVYFNGTYHLFYQHYPYGLTWASMHWGHATSVDLVHWNHQPIALFPDYLGQIFSGSAVVDYAHSAGFSSGADPALVAIFTHHHQASEFEGNQKFQYQSLAYSLDAGASWEKYAGNPVLNNPGIRDFRDPKVIWHEPSRKWIMVLAAQDRINFYGSLDLKSWDFLSEFGSTAGNHGGVWECPDLFPMRIEDTDEWRWILIVSNGDGHPNGGSGTQTL